jgi:hypothetical protein
MTINIEAITLGELFELHELRELDLSSPEQIARRGELIAKIFGPETELEEMTKKYLDLEVRFTQLSVELYNMRDYSRELEYHNRKLSAHIEQLKSLIQQGKKTYSVPIPPNLDLNS